jgi:hypothetical protein
LEELKNVHDAYGMRMVWPLILILMLAGGCAVVTPVGNYEESTPMDSGLAGASDRTAVVMPFDAKGNDAWGAYAAQRMKQCLIEQKAFQQVVYSEQKPQGAGILITGTLDHLSYGGIDSPTTVFLTIKVVSTPDGQVRFYRTAKASSAKKAFHLTWLRRVDVPSPYIENVLNGMLERIAKDIASRTALPAVQNP